MDDFDERLGQRLRALDAAVPTAAHGLDVGGKPTPLHGRGVRGLVAIIVGATVVGASLRQQPGTEPAATTAATTSSVVPSASSVILGSDGIPAQIDGQRVYRVTDMAEWQNLSGNFLLAANMPSGAMPACIAAHGTGAEGDLLAQACGGWSLGSTTGSDSDQASFVYAAPKSSPYDLLYGWANQAVVLRVHTHDSEAAGCSADKRAACEVAVVVEAVVWPTVPSEIDGQRVYRGNDLRSLLSAGTFKNLSGSFLLGGAVWVATNDWAPGACATAADLNTAGQQLLQECGPTEVSIDMAPIALASNFDPIHGQVVVVRAHLNDALAAQCPADLLTQCQEAIVVESVVWSSNPYVLTMPTPAPPFPTPTLNTSPASTP
jgi:hypothetical protein